MYCCFGYYLNGILYGVSHGIVSNLFFSFGSKLLVSGLLHTLYTNLYSLAIGKKMTSGDLGLYNRASTLAAFPAGNITDVMYKAMFPVLCTIQDSDEELEVYFLRYIRSACYVVFL